MTSWQPYSFGVPKQRNSKSHLLFCKPINMVAGHVSENALHVLAFPFKGTIKLIVSVE